MSNFLNPEKPIQLLSWQTNVFLDKHRYKVLRIGRRGGKTALCLLSIINYISQPNKVVWYAAPSYRQAKEIAWDTLLTLLKGKYTKIDKQALTMYFPNNSRIELKGTENPNSLRGNKIDFMIFDEVAFMRNWGAVWQAVRPILIDSRADCWFVSTPFGENHFFDLCNSEKHNRNYKSFHFTSYDNPNLSKEEINNAKTEMSAEAFSQEFLAEFTKMAGLIYKNYSTDMYKNIKYQNQMVFSSIDFGFAHKTAVLYGLVENNTLHINDCIYTSETPTIELAQQIKEKNNDYHKISNGWGDSAAPQLLADLATYGVNYLPIKKGADSVLAGINKVTSLINTNRLTISESIREIAHFEFSNYHWIESKKDNIIKQIPYKFNDDFLDALRYLVTGLFDSGYLTEKANLNSPIWYKKDPFITIEDEEDEVPIWYKRKLEIDKKLEHLPHLPYSL